MSCQSFQILVESLTKFGNAPSADVDGGFLSRQRYQIDFQGDFNGNKSSAQGRIRPPRFSVGVQPLVDGRIARRGGRSEGQARFPSTRSRSRGRSAGQKR